MRYYGHAGKILHIDVGTEKFWIEELDERLVLDYVGGRGLAGRVMFSEVAPGTDPLGPSNHLIFVNGPLAGTPAQSFARWIVTTRSPLTGTYMRSSGGGRLAWAMKRAGFDMVDIEGCAARPVCLHVTPEGVAFHDAAEVWGAGTGPTQDQVRTLVGDPGAVVACIGPAGEVGVRFACIFSDTRSASRGGVGTVMGAKRIKAIAFSGDRRTGVAEPERFRQVVRKQVESFRDAPSRVMFSKYGTMSSAEYMHMVGIFPTRNFQECSLPEVSNLSGDAYISLRQRDVGCHGCIVKCGKLLRVEEGPFQGAECDGPDYETIWAFSASLGCTDVGLTVAANQVCDELGMDTITTGNLLGFLMELVQRGIVSESEFPGLDLSWGRKDSILKAITMIGRREGIGELLSHGVKRVSDHLGSEAQKLAMHVKGLELSAYEPRSCKAQGLSFATSSIGAQHTLGYAAQEIYGKTTPFRTYPLSLDRKGYLCKYIQDEAALMETGIACAFFVSQGWLTADTYAELLHALTGIDEFGDVDHLWGVGERIFNLERLMNIREGFDKKDDTLPSRMLSEPLRGGPGEGHVFELDELLDEYYRERGWDAETGHPKRKTLQRLGLAGLQDEPEATGSY